MTNPHKHHHTPTTYDLTPLSQTKMALHAARHGTASSPVHGVLLGYRRRPCPDDDDGPRRLVVVVADAIPLCHEAPTKPLVEVALRIVEGYLEDLRQEDQHEKRETEGELKIVGWYTANAHVPSTSSSSSQVPGNAEQWEMPNLPAMKIASSMSESHPHDEDSDGDFVLALVSTSAWTSILNNTNNNTNDDDKTAEETTDDFHMCHLFERSPSNSTASFAHPVPCSRISPSKSDVRRILSEGLARVPLTSLERHPYEGGTSSTRPLMIYDYVDHVSNFGVDGAEGLGRRDWLENREVASFVDGFDVGKVK